MMPRGELTCVFDEATICAVPSDMRCHECGAIFDAYGEYFAPAQQQRKAQYVQVRRAYAGFISIERVIRGGALCLILFTIFACFTDAPQFARARLRRTQRRGSRRVHFEMRDATPCARRGGAMPRLPPICFFLFLPCFTYFSLSLRVYAARRGISACVCTNGARRRARCHFACLLMFISCRLLMPLPSRRQKRQRERAAYDAARHDGLRRHCARVYAPQKIGAKSACARLIARRLLRVKRASSPDARHHGALRPPTHL